MTLLSICTQVAKSIPVAAPTSIVGSTDQTAMLLLACAQDEGEALSRAPQGGWVAQITEYLFTTFSLATTGDVVNGSTGLINLASTAGTTALKCAVNGQGIPLNATITAIPSPSQLTMNQPATQDGVGVPITISQSDYALPSDYRRMVDGTLWDRTRFWQMRGAMSPQSWQLFKSSPIGRASIQRRWRIRLGSTLTAGSTPVFSIDPVPTDNGSTLVFEYVSNAWCQSSGGTAQTSWMADTDTGILDEYLIRLGVKWRMMERLGIEFAAAKMEYDYELDRSMAADGGAAILDMAPNNDTFLLNYFNIPEEGYGAAS